MKQFCSGLISMHNLLLCELKACAIIEPIFGICIIYGELSLMYTMTTAQMKDPTHLKYMFVIACGQNLHCTKIYTFTIYNTRFCKCLRKNHLEVAELM